MKNVCFVLLVLVIVSCGTSKKVSPAAFEATFVSTEDIVPFFDAMDQSTDDSYGLTSENPIKVGEKSASNQRRYIASLAGPQGEVLSFYRAGSCCAYKSENGYGGLALVDRYIVTYEGLESPITLYISFYDFEDLLVPIGFTKRRP